MAAFVEYCFKRSPNDPYVTSEQALMGVPLNGIQEQGVSLSGPAAWYKGMRQNWQAPEQHAMDTTEGVSSADGQPSAPPAEEDKEWQRWDTYYQTFCRRTGGMWLNAESYETSFFTQGIKWYSADPPHRLMIAYSTVDSNLRSRMIMGMPFVSFDVWASAAPGHNRDEGGGMDTTPGNIGEPLEGSKTSIGEYFQFLEKPYQDFEGIEDILAASGIKEYSRFICGYHIGGIAATDFDGRLCGLDWYGQTRSMINTDTWERWVITDQVCPTMGVYAKSFKRLGMVEMWEGHKTGKA